MPSPRCLRSKKLRALLWYAAGGKCQSCGRDLPDDWHADHVVPYVVTGRTNIHEMQALCPVCNARKGDMNPRKHQAEVIELFKAVQSGILPLPRFMPIDCICGGGKSIIPVIVAYFMIKRLRLADKIVWSVPQTSLRSQGAEAFLADKVAQKLLGHGLEIVENTNEPNPCKGTAGYNTSIQAIAANPKLHLDYFEKYRVAFFVDEYHHVHVKSKFARAIDPLISKSVLAVPMSGYWGRQDGYKLLRMRYNAAGELDMSNDDVFHWIHYSLEDALKEKAIIRTHFYHLDGAVKYEMQSSKEAPITIGSLGLDRRGIFAALHSEYAQQLMTKCYRHWKIYRKSRRRSKLLVVCADVSQAKMILKYLKNTLGEDRVEIATYCEDEANETIRRFRKTDEINVLVTVYKAYEGLDVPSITHLAILTQIRSQGWILQNIARAWRHDPEAGSWEGQVAHVFLPDDLLMRRCIEWIKDVQVGLSIDPPEEDAEAGGDGGTSDRAEPPDVVIPLSSAMTTERASGLAGERPLDDEEMVKFCNQIIEGYELPISTIECQHMIDHIKASVSPAQPVPAASIADGEDWTGSPWAPDFPARPAREISPAASVLPEKTPREKIEHYKGLIEAHVRSFAAGDVDMLKAINAELKIRYGPRRACGEETLRSALSYLQSRYPRKQHA